MYYFPFFYVNTPPRFSLLSLLLVNQSLSMSFTCSWARGDSVVMTSDDVAFVLNVTRDIEEGRLGAHNAPSLG